MRNKVVFLFAAVVVLLSCNKGEVYYRFHHIAKGDWYRDSVLVYRMDSLHFNPARQYDVTLELANNNGYAYRNCWLSIRHNLTDTVFQTDSLQVVITDEFGKPAGSGVGGLRQLSVPYLSSLMLDTSRVYEIHIRQAMRDNPLPGIEKVGVKIMETGRE